MDLRSFFAGLVIAGPVPILWFTHRDVWIIFKTCMDFVFEREEGLIYVLVFIYLFRPILVFIGYLFYEATWPLKVPVLSLWPQAKHWLKLAGMMIDKRPQCLSLMIRLADVWKTPKRAVNVRPAWCAETSHKPLSLEQILSRIQLRLRVRELQKPAPVSVTRGRARKRKNPPSSQPDLFEDLGGDEGC